MKCLRRAAVFLVVSLWLFAPDSPNAQQQPQAKTFQLAFCNISGASPIFIAVTSRKDGAKWTVEGWYPLLGFGCSIIGTFQADTVYFYAFGFRREADGKIHGVVWSPADGAEDASTQCADANKAFSRLITPVPGCPDGQVPVRFRMLKVAPDIQTYTFSLRD